MYKDFTHINNCLIYVCGQIAIFLYVCGIRPLMAIKDKGHFIMKILKIEIYIYKEKVLDFSAYVFSLSGIEYLWLCFACNTHIKIYIVDDLQNKSKSFFAYILDFCCTKGIVNGHSAIIDAIKRSLKAHSFQA